MAFSVVGTAFANATSVTIPAHQAGDIIIIVAWRNDSATPPTRPSGWASLGSGASGTFSAIAAWLTASDGSTVSGTWTGAVRLACAVVRDGTIDESAVGQAGSSSSDDFYWGTDPNPVAPRRFLLFGENNATYSGSAAHTTPSANAAWTTIGSVADQGSVIHLSDTTISAVDEFVSLTSSGGTPGYRTFAVPLIPADTVAGTLSVQETGSDTFSASGDVIVEGTLVVQESGSDTFSGTGAVVNGRSGTLVVQETGSDISDISGGVLVTGTVAAQETGGDTFSASGAIVEISTGTLAAQETGSDSFAASGFLSIVDDLPSASGLDRWLTEDSGNFLLEDDTYFLLESQNTSSIELTYENVVFVAQRPRTIYIRFGNFS